MNNWVFCNNKIVTTHFVYSKITPDWASSSLYFDICFKHEALPPHQFDPENVFNQEIKIGKISHWLLNTEEQQMPIFFVFKQEIKIGNQSRLINTKEQQMLIFFVFNQEIKIGKIGH
jgi:hypothetical protein